MQPVGSSAAEKHIEELEARARELAELANHLQLLAEQERGELARRLHDELGGLLTAAKMDLSWLQARVAGEAIQQRLTQLGGVLDEAMDLKRRVVEELRPSLLDHFGLPAAARAYVESTCGRHGLKSRVLARHSCETLPKEAAIVLFRIIQEGLSNTIRHARATEVCLDISGSESLCVLRLVDDGCGFDAGDPKFRWGYRLAGLRQRVRALGGRLEIESRAGSGTRLVVEIPAG